MNRSSLWIVLSVLALIMGVSACQPASSDTNRDASKAANANVAKETLNPVAIEAEITRLENEWATAAQRHDANAVRKFLADDLVMTYPDGSTGSKASELSTIESGAITADAWDLFDAKVTVLGPDAAFITGRSVLKNAKLKDATMKKAIDISGEYRFTDVYARRNGQWLAVASQTTPIKNPEPAPSPVATSAKAPATASPK
ncbi:MAG TPA: nuclear transport factor 2 family protein [Pyrinomonadaceae bacterium]